MNEVERGLNNLNTDWEKGCKLNHLIMILSSYMVLMSIYRQKVEEVVGSCRWPIPQQPNLVILHPHTPRQLSILLTEDVVELLFPGINQLPPSKNEH